MDLFVKIIVILVVIILLMYFSGGHGMFGRGFGISIAILLIFWLFKGLARKKDNK